MAPLIGMKLLTLFLLVLLSRSITIHGLFSLLLLLHQSSKLNIVKFVDKYRYIFAVFPHSPFLFGRWTFNFGLQNDFVVQSVEGMKVVCHELAQATSDPEGSAMDELVKDADRLVSCLANKAR